ncbi:MFS transporter [Thiotrichales bacterium 19X7-9]|nr:MFS transporter [Thiotrichales bacterium 19X7-9]
MSHHQTKHKWWVLVGTCIAGLVVALDFTIVNTVLSDMEYSLGASMHELQWFIAGFGITFCSFMTTMGKLADMLGRKKLLYVGMFVFTIASIGAGVSDVSIQLIICRLIQGVAGALIFPAGMAITVDAFPKEEEGRALGIYGSIMGIGLAFGPLLGGLITEVTSWRWVFYISVPLMILSFIIISLTARESKLAVKPKIDWWGMLWLTIFISSIIYILTEGDLYGWSSLTTISIFEQLPRGLPRGTLNGKV